MKNKPTLIHPDLGKDWNKPTFDSNVNAQQKIEVEEPVLQSEQPTMSPADPLRAISSEVIGLSVMTSKKQPKWIRVTGWVVYVPICLFCCIFAAYWSIQGVMAGDWIAAVGIFLIMGITPVYLLASLIIGRK